MPTITIGVSYRTDSNGKMHLENDCKALKSFAESGILKKLWGLDVAIKIKSLPAHASNQKEIERSVSTDDVLKDLEEVDFLYIPGAPSALDSQIGSSADIKLFEEEESFNTTKSNPATKKAKDLKDQKRKRDEYESRSQYELKLIDIARTRGMGILAVCAGSWRLLEAYGGGVRTLPKAVREYHHSDDRQNPWKIKHDININKGTMLHGFLKSESNENASL